VTLAEYLYRQDQSNRAFAAQIGVSIEYVRLLRAARRRPSPHIAERIEQATASKVTLDDFNRAYRAQEQGISPYAQLGAMRRRAAHVGRS